MKTFKLSAIDIFLYNIEYIIKYFEEHNEQNTFHFQNLEHWISIEKYQKLFHQYELFYNQIKQPLFRKRFLIQILIILNSFLTPIKEFQKNKFIFTQPQKENIINLSRLCMVYLHNQYNIYIYDLIQNEKNWLKWKENACPQVEKMKNL